MDPRFTSNNPFDNLSNQNSFQSVSSNSTLFSGLDPFSKEKRTVPVHSPSPFVNPISLNTTTNSSCHNFYIPQQSNPVDNNHNAAFPSQFQNDPFGQAATSSTTGKTSYKTSDDILSKFDPFAKKTPEMNIVKKETNQDEIITIEQSNNIVDTTEKEREAQHFGDIQNNENDSEYSSDGSVDSDETESNATSKIDTYNDQCESQEIDKSQETAGTILARISFRTLFSREWKPTWFVFHSDLCLRLYRSRQDFENYPIGQMIKKSVFLSRNHKCTRIKSKHFPKSGHLFCFTLWKKVDHTESVEVKFASQYENPITELRNKLLFGIQQASGRTIRNTEENASGFIHSVRHRKK